MNNLIKDKITIIITNRNSKYINIILDNFRKFFKDIIYKIIIINQEDSEPFKKGQLFNIAFKYVDTEYILLIDNDICNLKQYNLIKTYNKIKQPYLGFGYISQLALRYNTQTEILETKLNNNEYGKYIFMKYYDFANSGGYSNLCFNCNEEDIIFDYKLHHLKRINNAIGHFCSLNKISYDKSSKNNEFIKNLYLNNEMEFHEDGYKQTLFDLDYFYYKNDILYIGVHNIRVPENFKYLDLYNKYIKEYKEDIENIKKQDVGVSICITAYKAKDTIKDTLDSVIRQTWFQKYNNWEILLGIDNCAETLEYVKTIKNNYKNLKVFMMDSNKGTYVTTNTLMEIAKYENLIRFDSDDIMCPNMVETFMENSDKCDIQVARFAYLNNKWKTTRVGIGQQFVKKSIFEKYGGYRNWECAADYDFVTRISKFVKLKKLNDKYLFYYRSHNQSLTHTDKTGLKSELRKQLHEFIDNQDYENEENVKIKCITNTYKEIYSNIHEYNQDSYMYLMSLNKDWPNLC